MKMKFSFAFVVLLGCATVQAATITGVVTARGKEGADQATGSGGYESRRFKFIEKVDYSKLQDFLVFIEGPVTNAVTRQKTPARVLTQKDATFRPHVLPIQRGTTVEWPNEDEIFHNAFSMSETKPFDLGLYKDETKKITFDNAGRVDVFCSIHEGMHCIILVLENPFFAVTDSKGRYKIEGVPPGQYKLRAWHERMPPQTHEITVPGDGEVKQDFNLAITNLPKY